MLRTEDLASLLAGYLSSAGLPCDYRDFIFDPNRRNSEYLGVSIGFSSDSTGSLDIFLLSRFLDEQFIEYVSDTPSKDNAHFSRDPDLIPILTKIFSGSEHFTPTTFLQSDYGFKISGKYSLTSSNTDIFGVVLNRCLRPSWAYVRKHRPR